ncbi:MAG: hypothetical protein ABIH82_05380 [Candidatus Woesearchaeota archaeon]
MREGTSCEYSIFGIANPLRMLEPIKTEQFTDRYVQVGNDITLKVRYVNAIPSIIKLKERVMRDEYDVDHFQHFSFPVDPDKDPLKSFLKVRGLEDYFHSDNLFADSGIVIEKQRGVYGVGNIHADVMDFQVNGGETQQNFTICSMDPSLIVALLRVLHLEGESNLNFAEFLVRDGYTRTK